MENLTKIPNRQGRPRGQRFDCKVDLRVPRPMLKSLKILSKETKLSQAELIREGIEFRLSKSCGDWITAVRNPKTGLSKKLRCIENVRAAVNAVIACSEFGLQAARRKAQQKELHK